MIKVSQLNKTYPGPFTALDDINLNIAEGEIFALLGPNGAGKTTLISIICGIVNATSGHVTVGGFDTIKNYRQARSILGLVPQELTTDAFETVWDTVSFSRGLFGKSKNPKHIEKILKNLSLWDKKDNRMVELSGGMKRRVMIAKALSHEPKVLFLDEPSAGVDVELRADMWKMIRDLRDKGATVILTTHYIEEAEQMADRVGVINQGKIVLVQNKNDLIKKMGTKKIHLALKAPLPAVPEFLNAYKLELSQDKLNLTYTFCREDTNVGVYELLNKLSKEGIVYNDVTTQKSSLEEIFVKLIQKT